MTIAQQVNLKLYNSFGIDAEAEYFTTIGSSEQLHEVITQMPNVPVKLLGGGSNILLTGPVGGLVIKNEVQGIEVIAENEEYVYVRSGAGEVWHNLVLYCISRGWQGIENLSLIPGCVGAAPMQNIGAYGVELKDVFHELQAWHLKEHTMISFNLDDCQFGYRESVFKRRYAGIFAIMYVTLRLRKQPRFNVSYGAIMQTLERMGVTELTVQAISNAVISIRQSKLPNPAQIGNAGSFFKNPTIVNQLFESIKSQYPDVPGFVQDEQHTKVPAGWLIEACGYKGLRRGQAGVHSQQALVLVNYGGASGKEIYNLSQEILEAVNQKFQILLEREVNIW